ncbi:hypothetical protein GCM10007424_03570 [Flavobacterium suaedae]|uniref:Gliding motility lipoprotein GldH n=1 Tax=Flavobacterium suaedae TaxID=1767027 RepID=A0ABQ1JI37_9FLAO|nr:hypothetical protein [Flavobacterium suaedae]GGB66859.1 hypothetical protein GCM10007424_03570 [Flavobacterium suaedae]
MNKKPLYTVVAKSIFVLCLLFLIIGTQSCSNDSEVTNNEAAKSNAGFNVKSTEPVPKETGIFVEVDLISWDNNCFKYQLRIVLKDKDGERSLAHSAIIQTGSGCDDEGLVTNSYEGEYKGDFIIKDELPNGKPVRTYLDENPDVYNDYTIERDRVIADIK